MVEQSFENISDFSGIPDFEEVSHIIEGKDLETLIFPSIEILNKTQRKKLC